MCLGGQSIASVEGFSCQIEGSKPHNLFKKVTVMVTPRIKYNYTLFLLYS
jgi:hypothetical protein